MSQDAASAPSAAPLDGAAPEVCPITADFLPPNLRKHVDPKAPAPLRMMAAKSLVPLSPSDMVGALFMLTFDPDPKVRETARNTASALPDKILASALRDEGLQPPVLGFFLRALADKDVYAEMLILNGATPDEAVAEVAGSCSARLLETIGQNQLRVLRHGDILRRLVRNPNAPRSLVDSVCDFAVRSGLDLPDVVELKEARIRLFGPQAAARPVERGPTAHEVLDEFQELADESASPMEEGKRLTLTQRVMKMTIVEKIKLATLGNKEARGLLLRDSNKLVAVAAIRSPRITDGEVLLMAANRSVNDDVLRVIYNNREWTKVYRVKLALVKNPKTPMALSMKYLGTLRESDVKDLARDRNVPSGIMQQARKMIDKKSPKK
ncbi:MAG TPA: hypothetical protein VE782_16370 [Myxococcaceae bacterium]|nr:hypothetical protein [Myxococcaceae bacterium]